MKRQIRRGVYETNSSSTHSLVMCSEEEYNKWISGDVLYSKYKEKLVPKEDIIKELKEEYSDVDWNDEDEVSDVFEDEGIQSCEEFFDDEYLETFKRTYTTYSGDKVVAFGKYGYEG